ncbi:MAG TPA: ABC transporter ATP-binding protein [Gemmatimonadales bacterium]|jgi:ABC-type polysaccharide/polyol phosphate transport system ATPase subunit|nr:ABC transporter ATP-binding protein [Gemmatimonadales bacterium]
MTDAIAAVGVWKRFRLRGRSLGDLTLGLWPWRGDGVAPLRRAFWALEDVSFGIARGTTCAVMGANGSGKSTMLKLIAGMMVPTRGTIDVTGRLALLTHLGGGFHGDLTGRENVFLQGAVLGLDRHQLRTKLDAIFRFAELEAFADVPVKFYSAGMSLRLGFAIAAHVEPDILLIDEALAVGDAAFRDRCLERILAFQAGGTTLVLVSHDRYLIEQLCDQAVLLHRGRVARTGTPEEAFEVYDRVIEADAAAAHTLAGEGDPNHASLVIEAVDLVDAPGGASPVYTVDQPLTVRIRLRAVRAVRGAVVGVQLARDWHVLHGTRSNRQGIEITARAGETVTLELAYQRLSLSRGVYALHVLVLEHRLAQRPMFVVKRAARFRVSHSEAEGVGIVRLAHQWRLGSS